MDENGNAVMIQALAVGEPDIIMGHGSSTAQPTTFRCTRCNDPYTVIETEIPRFKVVSQDPHLRSAFLVMFVCMVIITTCSISILQDHWGTDRLIFDFQCCSGSSIGGGGGVRIKLHTTVVSWWFAVETCWMIWVHAGGRMNRKVIGVS
ncbi:hypothetical protein BDR26DRAFT_865161 [Obelidium mucronatum]|nr:hypothetical protein BDR26DRAFT_865161 [Obelidium mucronatum]